MKHVKKLYWIVLSIYLVSCTSYYQHNLKPVSGNNFWYQGKECAYLSETDTEIILYFSEATINSMHFYLEITNLDSSSVLIEPANINCFYHDTLETSVTDHTISYAQDPEENIERLDNEIVQTEKEHETKTAVCCVLMGVGVIAAIAGADSDDDDDYEYEDDEESTIGSTIDLFNDENESHNEKMSELAGERNFYTTELLRKTTLFADKTVSGLIILPRNDKKKYISINIPYRSRTYSFKFRQTIKKM